MTQRGIFITFEGGEGAGKSTQIKMLKDALEKAGVTVLMTREPGGTPLAEKIRHFVVQRDGGEWDDLSEALMFFAARREHLKNLIRPALEEGKWIISDRFVDSSRVYQGMARGLGENVIETLNKLVAGDFAPDLTIIFDLPPEEGLKRTGARTGTEDKFERLGLEFHKKIREGFLEVARNNPDRCVVIDALQDVDAVHQQVMRVVSDRYLKKDAGHGRG